MTLRFASLLSADIDTAKVVARANAAAACWEDAAVLPFLRQAVADSPSEARRWQMLGLAQRNLDAHVDALVSFREAVSRAPDDPLLALAHARTALEAGIPATELFDRALILAPLHAPVILGRAAAQFAEAGPAAAIDALRAQLALHPTWHEGHATASRLRWLAGDRANYGDTFEDVLSTRPRDGIIWREYALLVLRAGEIARLDEILARARLMLGESRTLDLIDAIARSESGEIAAADRLFAPHLPITNGFLVHHVRHLLRAGRPAEASAMLEARLKTDPTRELLPLAALAWRMIGDSRWDIMTRGTDLIRVFDLESEIGSIDLLADSLRKLHRSSYAPLDQSVRGGTQTDGPLFSRIDPTIRALRKVILGAVARYVAELPAYVAGHSMLGEPRTPLRFAGSWSVRLTDNGQHIDHVHPAGWISSAFYITVPQVPVDGNRAGWLTLGDAPSLGLPIAPLAEIEPKPGRLVLFPSTMWHRTRPFPSGERMTIAFDIARAPR